jgi:large subunit ribosomal protein L18
MIKRKNSEEARRARHARVRKKVSGTTTTPRLCVYRSLKNIYAQVIDDTTGKTLVSASTLDADLRANYGGNKEAAKAVGLAVAKKALDALKLLKGSELHSTVILSPVDTATLKKLGVNLTCEPVYQTKKLFHG